MNTSLSRQPFCQVCKRNFTNAEDNKANTQGFTSQTGLS